LSRIWFVLALFLAACTAASDMGQLSGDTQPRATLPTSFPEATAKGSDAALSAAACANALPPFVPWPPPRPTDRHVFDGLAQQFTSVSEFDRFLRSKLKEAGYNNFSYFSAPDGFLLATRIEQLDENRAPLAENRRWISDTVAQPLAPKEYWLTLLRGRRGYYRVMVFVLTTDTTAPRPEGATSDDAKRWVNTGCTAIPRDVGRVPITSDHIFYVLTYEFSAEKGRNVEQLSVGLVPIADQLRLAGLKFEP
jgi:hypothetical protein